MPRFSIFIDISKCSGCYSCFLSCRDEYYGNEYPGYSATQPLNGQFWIQVKEIERGQYPKPKLAYIPMLCQHCESAPCMDAAKGGAVYRRDDGIVIIDPDKAKGQDAIVNACPYRVIFWNAELKTPQKCTMCAHRIDEGEKMPRCVEACPTGALLFGDIDNPDSDVSERMAKIGTEELHPEFGTKPLIKYFGLPKRFIAGEVVLKGVEDECARDVSVFIEGNGETRKVATDIFGDFEFEGLEANSTYRMIIKKEGYSDLEIPVTMKKDVNLGVIVLEPC
jgi:Fe-S-cluster-containing dehydrogenase component